MEKMGTVLGRLLAQGSTPVAQGGLGSLAILHSASSPLAWAPGQYGGGVGQTRDDGNSTSRRGDLEAVTRPGGSSSWQWCSGELWWPTVGPTAQRGREAWVRLATQGLNQWNDEAHLGGNNGDGGSLKSSGGNGGLAASSDRRSTRVRCRLLFAWFKEGWCRGGKGGDGDARSPLKRGVVGKAGGWSSSVVPRGGAGREGPDGGQRLAGTTRARQPQASSSSGTLHECMPVQTREKGGALTCGPRATVPPFESIQTGQVIQTLLNLNFKLIWILTDPKSTFPCSKIFK
jgi:hypothetical protein